MTRYQKIGEGLESGLVSRSIVEGHKRVKSDDGFSNVHRILHFGRLRHVGQAHLSTHRFIRFT